MNTSFAKWIRLGIFALGLLGITYAHAQQTAASSGELKWINAPASLPEGAKLATLQGDPAKPGAYVFRLKLPAGYQLRPNSSPSIGRIVVVSGAFNLGAGEKFDKARTIPLYPGYVHWLDKSPYFGFTNEETVVEIEGVGPFAVNYVNAADDPATRKRVMRSAIQ